MNSQNKQTVQQMMNRGSCRDFKVDHKIPQEDLDAILQATQQSPTYINGQQYSIIAITEPALKEKMVELTMPSSGRAQHWVRDCSVFLLFVMDFNKIEKVAELEADTLVIPQYLEGLMIGTVDCGIALEATTVAAESLGYGTVSIGAVRRNTAELIKAFNLPKMTFPIAGLCVGVKADSYKHMTKPRLPLSSLVHQEQYEQKDWPEILKNYNEQLLKFQEKMGTGQYVWSEFVNNFYNKPYWVELSEVYKKQGMDIQ